MSYKYVAKNESDTLYLAQNIESEKFPGMIICLNGELGSGKTIFAKGIAKALGIKEEITSPTFSIIKEYYEGETPFFHMDVYRLEEESQNIGIEEYFYKDGLTVIEWAEIISDKLPEERLDITIKIIDENKRLFIFEPHGILYEEVLSSVL